MADVSELVPASRWLDHDRDETIILEVAGRKVLGMYRGRSDDWSRVEYDLDVEGEDFCAAWLPFVKCPDFERFVGLDGDMHDTLGDIDIQVEGLIYNTFVFRIGVRDGEPFIEQVTAKAGDR